MFSRPTYKSRHISSHLWRQHRARMAVAMTNVTARNAQKRTASAFSQAGWHQPTTTAIKRTERPATLQQRPRNPAGYFWVMRLLSKVVPISNRCPESGLVRTPVRTKTDPTEVSKREVSTAVSTKQAGTDRAPIVHERSSAFVRSVTLRDVTVTTPASDTTPARRAAPAANATPVQQVFNGCSTVERRELPGVRQLGAKCIPDSKCPLRSPFEGSSSSRRESMAGTLSTNLPQEGEIT